MAFKYHGYNSDMNDETQYECVPNALYKGYGNKNLEKWNYNARIAKCGLNYVKSMLDNTDEGEEEL